MQGLGCRWDNQLSGFAVQRSPNISLTSVTSDYTAGRIIKPLGKKINTDCGGSTSGHQTCENEYCLNFDFRDKNIGLLARRHFLMQTQTGVLTQLAT